MPNEPAPLVLADLDDTLFQTGRRLDLAGVEQPRITATLGKDGAPMSFMTPVQHQFVSWLCRHAEVVPVTARSVEALQRVQLPFGRRAVCSHGAVILDARGEPVRAWQHYMQQQLADYAPRLQALLAEVAAEARRQNWRLRSWVVEEEGLSAYLVVKQEHQDDHILRTLADTLTAGGQLDGFYQHMNGNNLALLPNPVNKKAAVMFLLDQDRQEQGERVVLGFGDSLSDLGFLGECHWWGTPRQGQIAHWLADELADHLQRKGRYDHAPDFD